MIERNCEKLNFDIELTEFDAAAKIKLIKEVRQMFGLSLKDAKDTVEKAPVTISKNVAKDDANSLKEKLEAIGCKITLL